MDIGEGLKELRTNLKLTAKEVADKIVAEHGLVLTDRTLYAYERGSRMPNAEMFIALCDVYQCKNICKSFGDVKPDYSIPTDQDIELIEKYHSLDLFGQDMVNTVLEKEIARCEAQAQKKQSDEIIEQIRKMVNPDQEPEKGDSTNESQTSKTG